MTAEFEQFSGSEPISSDRDHRKGLLIALAAFSLMSCADAVIKSMAGAWPPMAVAALRYTFGAIGLGIVVYRREGLSGFRTRVPRLQLMRGGSMAFCTIAYFSALFVMPLADAASIMFLGPMLVVVIAAVLLKEPVRPQIWPAIGCAFLGVLLILRPNLLVLGALALLPLAAALGNAFYMIGNRLTIGDSSIIAQQFFVAAICAPILIVAAVIAHLSGHAGFAVTIPAWHVVARCALIAGMASMAQWLLFRGTMLAGAAGVAPMVYVQIITATVIGWTVFGNQPGPLTMAGIGVIICSGLFLWRASRTVIPARAA